MALADDLYEKLTDEEDSRLCDEIGEAACRETPQSFVLILASQFLTKLGDSLASPKTTLAWLCSAVGAPAAVLGFLVPIRESGSMIPQLFIGSLVRRAPVRKWIWVTGSLGQALCVAGIGLTAIFLEGSEAGWAIVGLVTAFSLARGLCSVAAKDVLGKTIPKDKRGQLTGWSASAAGAVSLSVGAWLILASGDRPGAALLGSLLLGAGALWLLAAMVYARVPEFAGETSGGRNVLEAIGQIRLLASDRPFRRFVATRALLMCSALSAPFYVALSQSHLGSPAYLLGAFIVAAGLADLISAPVWGRLSDRSSRQVMITAAGIAAVTGIVTFLVDRWLPGLIQTPLFLPLMFLLLSVAHSGVRVGRKTYVVNLGTGNRRTDYVAVSNTVIGLLLLIVGSVGALAPVIGNAGVLGLLAVMGLLGMALGYGLPEVDR